MKKIFHFISLFLLNLPNINSCTNSQSQSFHFVRREEACHQSGFEFVGGSIEKLHMFHSGTQFLQKKRYETDKYIRMVLLEEAQIARSG